MDLQDLLLTSARAVAVYVMMLLVIRMLGKRTVGNFSAFDLLVALMLGEVVDEIIYGDVRFLQGTVAIVTLGALAFADSTLSYVSRPLRTILEGKPAIVIRAGRFQREGMRSERLSEQDLIAMLRLNGIRDIREVELAVLETDGELSVLRYDWAEAAQKYDVERDAAREREKAVEGHDDPPPSKRTDTPAALGEAA
jgi:uncharacterized membrane protein YcaP (DUF421 family)